MKKRFLISVILLTMVFLSFYFVKDSFAFDYDSHNLNLGLNYSDNNNILKKDCFNYINLIDDSIFESYYFDSSVDLNENYEFITNFAISFILANEEYYKKDILIKDEYSYIDSHGKEYNTNKYISLDVIYNITDSVFGVKNYYILNDYLKVKDSFISLLKLNYSNSKMEIEDISSINNLNDYIFVSVKYKNFDYKYIYKFKIIEDKLILVNLNVEG